MNSPPIIAILALSLVCSIGCESTTQASFDPPRDTLATATSASGLYLYHCAACHGTDGRPTGAAVTDLRDYRESFGTFDSALTDGPGTMPKFPHLNPAARRLIYDYVLEFTR